MKYLVATLFTALAVAAYAPQADAGCGACGNEGKPHTHEPGHKHETKAADCAACGKPCEAWPTGGGYGHNGAPFYEEGRVCNACNGEVVAGRFYLLNGEPFGVVASFVDLCIKSRSEVSA